MDATFSDKESLLRAVYPPARKPIFWQNGKLSSAAFKDKKGLSVERTYDRTIEEAALSMSQRFVGFIVYVTVSDCKKVNAYVKYCPSSNNKYHSEIHGSEKSVELNNIQAFILARSAKIQVNPSMK
ncbi:hypothetical protein [Bifidobacterium sp.]|uniref:hypothetical protein n=1 Tax=Bifidobacterium sp. TaxID=41200 RepID=UPI00257BD8E0|nr:hypothetical protein [Bifidobacterium sp.]MBS5401659.1 hypothetical protein [Bifidobacterium sp.]